MKKKVYYIVAGIVLLLTVGVIFAFTKGSSTRADVDVATLVKEYSNEDIVSMQQLDLLVMEGDSSIEVMRPYIANEDPKARWLAVYVIGRVSDESSVQVLLPLLQDDSEIVRISAAGTLANKGYVEALPVLIEGTQSTEYITYMHPERSIATFSQEVLAAYTQQEFTEYQEWQDWWQKVENTIRWDKNQKFYTYEE